jgi:hypothetical protein
VFANFAIGPFAGFLGGLVMGRFILRSASALFAALLALPVQAQPPEVSLLAARGGIPCQVVMGRVVLVGDRLLAGRSDTREDEANGQREVCCVQANAGQMVLRYERVTSAESLAIDFVAPSELRMRYVPGAETKNRFAALFVQRDKGPLTLEIGAASERRVLSADSLWHLLLSEPQACHDHLLPLLDELHPDWRLAAQAEAAEQSLLAAKDLPAPPEAEHFARLLAELGDEAFGVRQAAEGQLRGFGVTILPLLSRVRPASIDAEQRRRIARIGSSLQPATADTPERIAAWLAGDELLLHQLRADRTVSASP